jgi:hypothetical protein
MRQLRQAIKQRELDSLAELLERARGEGGA